MTLLVRYHPIGSLRTLTEILLHTQLRRASGKFTNFVLTRVIRLTIETNTLTGTYFSERPTQTFI